MFNKTDFASREIFAFENTKKIKEIQNTKIIEEI